MKISKLFHWLYAILMLLPVAMFIPTAFYYGFNEQAQAQTKTIETLEYYDTSDPWTTYDITNCDTNTVYTWMGDVDYISDSDSILVLNFAIVPFDYEDYETTDYTGYGLQPLDDYIYVYSEGIKYCLVEYEQFIFVPHNINEFDTYCSTYFNSFGIMGCLSLFPKNSTVSETYTMSITDSMSTAWTDTWSNPLFSWSANGFLIAPFNYITNLFGMPNNSTFSLALNYWLTISIVYLVFDLVMYVPLLAHRWIDKGMVE